MSLDEKKEVDIVIKGNDPLLLQTLPTADAKNPSSYKLTHLVYRFSATLQQLDLPLLVVLPLQHPLIHCLSCHPHPVYSVWTPLHHDSSLEKTSQPPSVYNSTRITHHSQTPDRAVDTHAQNFQIDV
jgi:hypothetical protein